MALSAPAEIEDLLGRRAYGEAKSALRSRALEDLARAWGKLGSLHQLVAFKLLDPARAMQLFDLLTFSEQFHLLCGFPPESIAPVTEDLDAGGRRLFCALPRDCYERMLRRLLAERNRRARGA